MKEYETVTVTEKSLKNLKCDLCGKLSFKSDNWSDDAYYSQEVTIESDSRSTYPEDNEGHKQSIDLCPDCFEDRLIPWLKSQNCNIPEVDEYRCQWQSWE